MKPPQEAWLPPAPKSSEETPEWGRRVTVSVKDLFRGVYTLLRNQLSFGDNMDGQIVDVNTPGTPDAEFAVNHVLDRVPTGFLPMSVNKAAVVYKGSTAWTNRIAYFKCNVATVVVKLFIT